LSEMPIRGGQHPRAGRRRGRRRRARRSVPGHPTSPGRRGPGKKVEVSSLGRTMASKTWRHKW
jgi:hypothetical protein